MSKQGILAGVVFVFAFPSLCFARSEHSSLPLQYNWGRDGSLTFAAGALWLASEWKKEHLAPLMCRWCASNEMDRVVSEGLRWNRPNHVANIGNVAIFALPVALGAAITFSAWQEGGGEQAVTDLLLVAETVAISGLVAQTIKYAVGRKRPFVAELPTLGKKTREYADNNLSFYSQHTNLAFCLVFSFGTIAHIRKYQAEPWIWGLGLPAASLIGYSRIASQKHYLTDVLVGAGMGAFSGWLVPWLHSHQALPKGVAIQGGPQGVVVTGVF